MLITKAKALVVPGTGADASYVHCKLNDVVSLLFQVSKKAITALSSSRRQKAMSLVSE